MFCRVRQLCGVVAGSHLRGQDKKHFVVVPLDGAFRVKDMAPSIQAIKKAAEGSNGAVGVGLVSMMGFEHTRNELSVSCLVAFDLSHMT